MKKINISIFTTKWGHLSIAKAVEDKISANKNYKIHFNYIPVEVVSELTYMPIYRLFPHLFKLSFKASERNEISMIVIKYLEARYKKQLLSCLETQKPEVVINTYFAFNSTFEKVAKELGFLFINIVPDPRTFHRITLSNEGYNFVFDDMTVKKLLGSNIRRSKIIKSGWFVRDVFKSDKSSGDKISSKKMFTATIVGGSAGNYSILKILPAFIKHSNPVKLNVICGTSDALYKSVSNFSNLFSTDKLYINTLKFTNDINKYFRESDLIIGKAGPNLLFEAVSVRKPFYAISHIAGQEDGNLEIIKEYGIGVVNENPITSIRTIRKIISNPEILNQYYKNINKLAGYNDRSGVILNKFIEKHLP